MASIGSAVSKERLERDRRGLLAGGNQLGRRFINLLMQRIVEVLRLEESRNAVVRLVVDEDGAEERLFGLEIVGSCPEGQAVGRGCFFRLPQRVRGVLL